MEEEKTHLTIKEVRLLAGALGFTRDLVQSKVPPHVIVDEAISIQDLVHYCDEGFFAQELHFTCNSKTGNYNTEVFKRAALHYAKHNVTVNEIRDARMAFETYEEFDQRGMVIYARTLMRTLKIIGRVVAPEKLIKKIRHVKMAYQEKGRIQLYEFLDLLPLCEKLPVSCGDADTKQATAIEKTKRKIYNVDNFPKFMVPEDKRLHAYLNRCYHHEQLRYSHPYFISQPFPSKQLVIKEPFDQQVEQSMEDRKSIRKQLSSTDKEIKLSKSGNLDERNRREGIGSHLTTSHLYMETTKHGEKASRSSTMMTKESAVELKHKRKKRTSTTTTKRTSPYNEVINDNITTKTLINQLSFDLNTQDVRSKQRLHEKLKSYLPNYEEVVARIEQKQQQHRTNETRTSSVQPLHDSPYNYTRLSKPRSGISPKQHLQHCTASHRYHSNSNSRRRSATVVGENGRKKKVRRKKVKSEEKENIETLPTETSRKIVERKEQIQTDKISVADGDVEQQRVEDEEKPTANGEEETKVDTTSRCRELEFSEVSDIIRKMGKVYIKYNTEETNENNKKQLTAEKLEQKARDRRNEILDNYRRDSSMQTTNVSDFELKYLSHQPNNSNGEVSWANRPISTTKLRTTDIEKELKYRKTFNKIAKRIMKGQGSSSLYLCSLDSVTNLKSMYQHRDV